MSLMLRFFSGVLILIYFIFIFSLLKKKKFALKYSLLWLLGGGIMLFFVLFPQVLVICAKLLGFEVTSNAFFVLCIFMLIMLLISQTAIVSNMNEKNKRLAQKLAILERRVRECEEKVGCSVTVKED